MKQKIAAFFLAGFMAIALCTCGGTTSSTTNEENEITTGDLSESDDADDSEGKEDSDQKMITSNESDYNVGDTVTLGRYNVTKVKWVQVDARTRRTEYYQEDFPLEWTLLSIEGNKALVVSKYVLFNMAYAEDSTKRITWENCGLREFLNNDFYETAFSDSEKDVIWETKISNPDNEEYGTDGGNDTIDKVFILSTEELLKYYPTDSNDYFTYHFTYAGDAEYAVDYWTRTVGYDTLNDSLSDTGIVYSDGSWGWDGKLVSLSSNVIPAMYIDLNMLD